MAGTIAEGPAGRRGGGHPAAGGGHRPRADSRVSSVLAKFSYSELLISKVYDFPRRSSRSDDVCSLSSSERMGVTE